VRSGRGLASFAALVLGFMVLVILWGAVVRATGSGAGCGNHWPLCNGDFIPQHPRLATVIEFTHRSMSGICTTLLAALIAWTFFARRRGDRVRRAVVWSGILLLTEAFLGAVLVKGGYVEGNASDARVLMQCIHFTNTMLLLAALTLAWWWLRPSTYPLSAALGPASRTPAPRTAATLALAGTVIAGATGSVAALADTLFPSPSLRAGLLADFSASSPLLVRMRWVHPAAALVALACTLLLAWTLRSRASVWLTALAGAQVLLGLLDVLLLAPIPLQLLHLLGADLFWIALVATAADVLLNQNPGPAAARSSAAHPRPV
jgi:cytochrome c oxidase assembly protein subunit 15